MPGGGHYTSAQRPLSRLRDVNASARMDGDILVWNAATNKYISASLATAGAGIFVPYTGATGPVNLNARNLTNVASLEALVELRGGQFTSGPGSGTGGYMIWSKGSNSPASIQWASLDYNDEFNGAHGGYFHAEDGSNIYSDNGSTMFQVGIVQASVIVAGNTIWAASSTPDLQVYVTTQINAKLNIIKATGPQFFTGINASNGWQSTSVSGGRTDLAALGATDPRFNFLSKVSVYITNGPQIAVGYNTSNFWQVTTSSAGINVFDGTGGSAAFRFNKNVGIGVDPGTYALSVSANTGAFNYLVRLENTTTGSFPGGFLAVFPNITAASNAAAGMYTGKDLASRNGYGLGYFHSADGSTSNYGNISFNGMNNILVWTAAGLVGILTTTPAVPFHVLSTNTNGQARFGNTGSQYLNFYVPATNSAQINMQGATPGYDFRVNGGTALTLNAGIMSLNNPSTGASVFFVNSNISGCWLGASYYASYEDGLYSASGDERIAAFDYDNDIYYYANGRLKGNSSGIYTTDSNLYFLGTGYTIGIHTGAAGAMMGRVTLVAGVGSVTISGLTTSDYVYTELVTPGGVMGARIKSVITTNTLTVTAVATNGTTVVTDTSILSYFIVRGV